MTKLLKKVFMVPEGYKTIINNFDNIDGALALIIFLLYGGTLGVLGLFVNVVTPLQITYIGGILGAIYFFNNCLSHVIFEGKSLIPVQDIILYIFYYLAVALVEEVLFRGYILGRIHKLTKRVYLDVIISGILFVLMHFPFRMVAYNMSFIGLISNVSYMMDLFVTHVILSFIRIRSNSIYGAIFPHWMSNLANKIVVRL